VEIRHLISHLGRDRTVMLSTHVLPEVAHTCSRLLIIHRGRIAADGPVDQLVAQAEGLVQIGVEIQGTGVVEAIKALPGVRRVDPGETRDGRVRLTLSADSSRDLRPEIFQLAKQKSWVLYELHQAAGSVEDLFRNLTAQTSSPTDSVPASTSSDRSQP
jgi:ABC-2 type transport system ATP-binding protein